MSPSDAPTVVASADRLVQLSPTVVAIGFTRDNGSYVVDAPSQAMLDRLEVDAFALLDRADAKGRGGETVRHEILPAGGQATTDSTVRTVVLVGLGRESPTDFRRAGAAVTRAAGSGADVGAAIAARAEDDELAGFAEGLILGGFRFSRKSQPSRDRPPTITLTDSRRRRAGIVDAAVERAHASWRSRSYALTPSNEKGPQRLEEWARDAAATGGLDVDVWDERRLARDGFGGVLAVGRGSAYPSRFIRLDYAPTVRSRGLPSVVLVGKGVTFDTGGLSIKPGTAMQNMKRDMTGAGVVIAAMASLRALGVRARVTGLVASAENAFGAASMRPGDVVAHFGGRTSEVQNTDAEGRLLLADGLAYAADRIKPDVVIDIATLTGASRVALGTSLGGLFANDDALASALTEAGDLAGEPVWRLPLCGEYESLLESEIADANNSAGTPGAITAALFLQHFVGPASWAHLDIASVGDSDKDAFEYTKGATGFGARLLLRWLASAYA